MFLKRSTSIISIASSEPSRRACERPLAKRSASSTRFGMLVRWSVRASSCSRSSIRRRSLMSREMHRISAVSSPAAPFMSRSVVSNQM